MSSQDSKLKLHFSTQRYWFTLRLILLCLLSLGFFTAASATTHLNDYDSRDKTYRLFYQEEPSHLNIIEAFDTYSVRIMHFMTAGLVRLDYQLELQPELAKHWRITPDGKTYTFTLRSNLQFHDGTPITAADFAASFEYLINPDSKSIAYKPLSIIKGARAFHLGEADNVAGIRAIDDYTLEIVLERANANFLKIIAGYASIAVYPKEQLARGQVHNDNRKPFISAGPYVLKEWKRGEYIRLERFEQFHAKEPLIETIEILFPNHPLAKGRSEEDLFLDGIIDHLFLTPQTERVNELAAANSNINLQKGYPLILKFFGLNTRSSTLSDSRVRQALNYIYDNESVISADSKIKHHIPAYGLIIPGLPGYDRHFKAYEKNHTAALDLLKQAGYNSPKEIPTLLLGSISGNDDKEYAVANIQQQLNDFGIATKLKEFPNWDAFKAAMSVGEIDIYPVFWNLDYPDINNLYTEVFHSNGSFNFATGQNSARVDELIEQYDELSSPLERVELAQKIEQILLADPHFIPRFTINTHVAFSRRVGNTSARVRSVSNFLPHRDMYIYNH